MTPLKAGPVTLYAQLASIIRDKIYSGNWKLGEEIPTIEEFASAYGVAKITVRQAIQLLSAERLLSSGRGRRTVVIFDGIDATPAPFAIPLASIERNSPHFSVRLLSKEIVASIPERLFEFGTPEGNYVLIRKIDCEGVLPYAHSTVYVAQSIYNRFPEGAEASSKVIRLITRHAADEVGEARERISVTKLTYDEAVLLQTSHDMPAGRVCRVLTDRNGKILFYGVSIYRGDRFAIDRDIRGVTLR